MIIYNEISELLTDIGIKEKVKNIDFFIYKIEDHFGHEQLSVGPYKHSFFELTYGSGHDVDCKIGASSFKPLKDSLSFATPYQMSSWKVNSFQEDALGYTMYFKPQLLSNLVHKTDLYKKFPFFNLHTTPMITLNVDQRKTIVALMGQILSEYQNYKAGEDPGILAAYVTLLLEKIKRFYIKGKTVRAFNNRAEEITFLFENLLKEKGTYARKVADYASDLNLSPIYLSEAIKEVTGKAPLHLIQEYLILQAKGLLLQSTKTISEVSYDLGFGEASNFVKYFKKYTGITPNKYRKEIIHSNSV